MCLCKYYRHQSWKSLAWLVYILCFLAALLPLPNQPGAVEGELVWVGVAAAPLLPFLTELSDVVSKKPNARWGHFFNSLGQVYECRVVESDYNRQTTKRGDSICKSSKNRTRLLDQRLSTTFHPLCRAFTMFKEANL